MLISRINVHVNIKNSIARDRLKRIVESIDPDGARRRKTKKLKRREYHVKGYGSMLHIDTNHKLGNKTYAFVIASIETLSFILLLWIIAHRLA